MLVSVASWLIFISILTYSRKGDICTLLLLSRHLLSLYRISSLDEGPQGPTVSLMQLINKSLESLERVYLVFCFHVRLENIYVMLCSQASVPKKILSCSPMHLHKKLHVQVFFHI